ncbi:hypothetical protein HUU61_17485 [Rhodopseudomonas palustris]|uniref:FimV N-terminal domain-containing protein n=1 Tax=Thiospirillum jenense TaxID=1653858 RepID=A0A839HER1_9GAMM|nr:FimV/HubP family polar landmark protein [Thiospirillum jenense]MBB1093068.1 hypothetical protein [Rhodopseudomonas palustris]MBB1127141.1 hypothetical protein [Thiospirillum jenense]
MARSIFLLATVALTLVSTSVWSLGLGTLLSKSALNQPFHGEIPLYDVKADELDTVKVRLASAEEFAKAGAPRSQFLTVLQFQAKPNENGQPIIHVTSREPVREPFLDFLVEVVWPQGRLVKEYTILLDPPRAGTTPPPPPVATPKAPAETPAVPGAADTASESPTATTAVADAAVTPPPPPAPVTPPVAETPPAPVPVPPPVASTPPPAVAEVAEPEPEPEPESPFPIRYGPIKSGAGLWRVANSITPDGATTAQTAMALYRCNPQAFGGGKINNLVAGRSLVIPSAAELFALDAATADREFKAALAGEPVRNTPLAPPVETSTAAVESKKKPPAAAPEPIAEAVAAPDKPVELTPPAPPPPPVASNPPIIPPADTPVDQPVAANPPPPVPVEATPVVPLSAPTPTESSPPTATESPLTTDAAPPAAPLTADADTPEAAAMRQRILELESRLNNIGDTLDKPPQQATPPATETVVKPPVAEQAPPPVPVTPKPKLIPPPPPPPAATSPLDMLAALPIWALGAGGGLIAALLGFLIYRRSAARSGDKPSKSSKTAAAKDKKPKRRSSLRTKEAASADADSSVALDSDTSSTPAKAATAGTKTPEELDFNITLNLPPLDVPPGATAPVTPPPAPAPVPAQPVALAKPAEVVKPTAAVAPIVAAVTRTPPGSVVEASAPAPVVTKPAVTKEPVVAVVSPAPPPAAVAPELASPPPVAAPPSVAPVSPATVAAAPAPATELTGQQKTALLQADLFLSYGRYSEAQLVLQRALEAMPAPQLKYKLAEVYSRAGDTNRLLQLIGTMMAAGDDRADPSAWGQVLNLLSQPAAPLTPPASPAVVVSTPSVAPTPPPPPVPAITAAPVANPVALQSSPAPVQPLGEAAPAPVPPVAASSAVPMVAAAAAVTVAAVAVTAADEIVAAPPPAPVASPPAPVPAVTAAPVANPLPVALQSSPVQPIGESALAPPSPVASPPAPVTSHREPESSADVTHTLVGFELDPADDWDESLTAEPVVEPPPSSATKRMAALDIADLSPGAPEAAVSLPVEEWDKSIAAAAGLSGTDPFADLDALGESESTGSTTGWNTAPAPTTSEAFISDSRDAMDLAADLEKLLAGDDSPPIASLRPSDVANDPRPGFEALDNLDIDVLEDAVGLSDAAASSVADSIFQLPTPTEVEPPPPLPPVSTPAVSTAATAPQSTPVEPPLPLDIPITPSSPAPSSSGGGRFAESEPFGPDSGASDVLSSQWQMDSGLWDEVATKMDLAFAYIEMDDPAAARGILEEVVREGNDEQRAEAAALLAKLGNS